MKTCSGCGLTVPLSEFYKDKTMTDGRLNQCKDCVKARVRLNRRAKIDHYREYDLNRKRRGGPKDYSTPEQRAARSSARRAVVAGLIEMQPCVVCGKRDGLLHAHHEDYSKPLEVKWFCPPHHKQYHIGCEYY